MMEPPKAYCVLRMDELADWIVQLIQSDYANRIEINMALAEVYTRLSNDPDETDARQLDQLSGTLHLWLRRDDVRRMGGPQYPEDGSPYSGWGGHAACMCSVERLETRAKRGD